MHDVVGAGKDDAQDNDKNNVGGGGDPVHIDDPQTRLQQDTRHSKDERQPKARLGKEEPVPVGLHRPERERQVGDPEEDARTPKRGGPVVEGIAFHDERDQPRQPGGNKRQFRGEHPGAVQVHDPHIGAKVLLFGTKQRQESD